MSLDGGVVVKVLLVAGLWLAGWGARGWPATVLPDAGVPGQFVAATLAVWNPYVAERLLQGHWSLLVGYGCLPWVAATVLRMRSARTAPLWIEVCAAGVLDRAGRADTDRPDAGRDGGAGLRRWRQDPAGRARCARSPGSVRRLLAALPWLTAAAVSGSLSSSQADGVPAFAARAEPGLGTLGQPGQPGRHLERRGRTCLPDNAFRGGGDRRAAGRGGGGPADVRFARRPRFRCSSLPPSLWWCRR